MTQTNSPRARGRPLGRLAAALTLAAALFLTCRDAAAPEVALADWPQREHAAAPYASYRDIPGVTSAEITAVNALRERFRDSVLVYGMTENAEAFIGQDGKIYGFAALVSEYMNQLFGLDIRVQLYDWSELIPKLEAGEIHFTGELTPTEERRETYLMTNAIANRYIVYFRLKNSEPLSAISETRRLRYGFLAGTTTIDAVLSVSNAETIDVTEVPNPSDGRVKLLAGEIDAFFDENALKNIFLDGTSNIAVATFLPQIHEPISITTRRIEFTPLISIMDKFLRSGGDAYFADLYRRGEREYTTQRFLTSLTDAERAYVADRPTVKFAAEHANYPLSFYNANEKEWQGITFDVLRAVEELSGIKFKVAHDKNITFAEQLEALERGDVSIISELIRTKERQGRFLWADTPLLINRYTLVSKADRRPVDLSDIPNLRVGVTQSSAFEELFKYWFPGHKRVERFPGTIELFDALEQGKVDLVMSSQTQLLTVTNYLERPGYKSNILFEYSFESTFGFHKNDTLLCAVVDKAMRFIDLENIADVWLHKTYDYRMKMAQARQPLLISISALLLCILILLTVIIIKNRSMGKQMEALVKTRTEELNEQMKIMDAVTANYKGIIFYINDTGVLTMLRGGYVKSLDPDLPSAVGHDFRDVGKRFEEYSVIVKNVERTFHDGPQSYMSVIDGYTFMVNTTPIYDADGKVAGVTGSIDDITEMVRLNSELENALEEAKSANRAKSAFLANMSHEIRTPMNSVIGFSELALDFEMSEKPREYITKILENSKGLLQIINDILDISKVEAGKMVLEKIPFELQDVFALCKTATEPKAAEKGLGLHFYVEPRIGQKLLGDPLRLRQVFINLISNAIKFTNIGTIKVSAVVTKETADKAVIHFEVRDSGIGMTEEQVKMIAVPFTQTDHSTTRKYGGTGLGLSIVKSIAELMGSELRVESWPGIGSKFSFDTEFPTITTTADFDVGAARFGEELEKPILDGEVLVCEDNRMNQEVIRRHLERVGLRVKLAENGKAGVDAVKERMASHTMFDLIFMDINMPIMDGITAAVEIAALGANVPIVAMTANVMTSDREQYQNYGMSDCVGKPFTSQELWRCLLKYIKPAVNVNGVGADVSIMPGYDNDLILEMRAIFAEDNQNTFNDFMGAIAEGNISGAHRIAHTLKSNAGTIGRPRLQKAAAKVEKRVVGGVNLLTDDVVDALKIELKAALAEFEPLIGSSRGAAFADTQTAADFGNPAFIEEFENLLQRGNPDCLKFKNALRDSVPNSSELIEFMENFDFDKALAAFEIIKKEYGGTD